MKPQLSQKELEELYIEGKVCIWAYKDRYQIEWSHGMSKYILRKTGRFNGKLGITQRGRFIAMTSEDGREAELRGYELSPA